MKLWLIDWEDAFGCSTAWAQIENLEVDHLTCRSVGEIVYEDKRVIVVVPHTSAKDHRHSERQGCGDMTIPKSAIRRRTRLKKA